MREIILRLKENPRLCIEVDEILPENIAGKKLEEIEKMEIRYGNSKVSLGDFFDVYGDASDSTRIVFEGDLKRVKRIGFSLRKGEIVVYGDTGMYVGAFMEGGKIVVEGNVGPFAALNMKGGEMLIRGNCGDYLGASYRGEWRGMKGGKIVVEGSAGREVGGYMQGGKIVVKSVDLFAGAKMRGGIIIAEKASSRLGAGMTGGYIVVNEAEDILPGFFYEGTEKDPKIEGERFKGNYRVFSGDHAEKKANGKLFIKL
jgi:formylmethanofuran dehydrogenase subunit C